MEAQRRFYDALTSENILVLNNVFDYGFAAEVDEVADRGGSIDGWDICLKDGARSSGNAYSISDVLVISES